MLFKHKRKITKNFAFLFIVLLLIGSFNSAYAEIQAGMTACTKKGARIVENRTTYVCTLAYGSKKDLVWARLITPSTGLTKPSSSKNVIVVNSTPKPIPSNVPGTLIP